MQSNLIKLPDEENMHHHFFCPQCHYWLFGEDVGSKYCPHCGTALFWNSEKVNNFHTENYDFAIKRYNALIEWKEKDNGKRDSN